MSEQNKNGTNEPQPAADKANGGHWLDDPANVKWGFKVFYIACGAACAIGLVLTIAVLLFGGDHDEAPLDRFPVLYGAYGFLAIALLIALAKGLRKLVRRDEDYYD